MHSLTHLREVVGVVIGVDADDDHTHSGPWLMLRLVVSSTASLGRYGAGRRPLALAHAATSYRLVSPVFVRMLDT